MGARKEMWKGVVLHVLRFRSSRLYLVASLSAAVLAALSVFAYLRSLQARVAASGKLVELVVAARDIRAGEVLDAASLDLVPFPDRYLLPGTFTDRAEVSGRVLRYPVRQGEPLLASAILSPQEGPWATSALDAGLRAFPLPCEAVAFPPSQLTEGSRVDVVCSRGGSSRLALENIKVVAVFDPASTAYAGGAGEEAHSGNWTSAGCILLAVTPEESCELATALEDGRVEIALRPAREP